MAYFKHISFINYRNFENHSFSFSNNCNVIFGGNGSGKTNILEGISLFEKGRGFRKEKINNLINFENSNNPFNINSIFHLDEIDLKINVFNNEKNIKILTVNDSSEKDSIAHFESLFSIIHFLPEMERLFILNPSSRRNFIDRLIFNYNKKYNLLINNYKKNLLERQSLLKNSSYEETWIQHIENNIAIFGSDIYRYRINHIENINKILKNLDILKEFKIFFSLSLYDPFLDNNPKIYENQNLYSAELRKNRNSDFFSGRCAIGPHRSDIYGYNISNKFNVNQFSTGQQKTIILLIIIAQCKFLIESLKFNPIVLLDEVCSHLDHNNRELLLYLIQELKIQIFMTGTEESFFSFLSTKANYCNIT